MTMTLSIEEMIIITIIISIDYQKEAELYQYLCIIISCKKVKFNK